MEASFQVKGRRNGGLVRHAHCRDDGGEQELIQPLFAKISEISTLPEVAVRTLQMIDDPRSSASELATVIGSDPALAVRVLRAANSSFCGLSQRVDGLDHAVVLLGFREIRSLAFTAHVAKLFRKTSGHGSYRRQELWHHMVSVAVVARHLARICQAVSPEEAYLAGLLHDVGIVLLDQTLHGPFCQVVDSLAEDTSAVSVENAILGFDHASLGQYALRAWGLPGFLVDAAAYHHQPLECGEQSRPLVSSVALANSLCHRMGIRSLGVATLDMLPNEVFTVLGLRRPHVTRIVHDLPGQLERSAELARLSLG
ncbi:MAG: HDOD domain-containing protein [Thermoguttaceae bacterium]